MIFKQERRGNERRTMGRHHHDDQHCPPWLPNVPPKGFPTKHSPTSNFDLSTTVLVTIIVTLVFLIVLVVVLHLYARYLIRHRRRAGHWATVTIFRSTVASPPEPPRTGLNDADIARIPKFAYKLSSDNPPAECSICLSVVEEGEVVRALPSCKHVFHLECIDTWLHSHHTCPVCRAGAEPPASVAVRVEDGEASEMDGGGGGNGEGTSGSKEGLGVAAELVVPKDAEQGEVNQESAR